MYINYKYHKMYQNILTMLSSIENIVEKLTISSAQNLK